MPTSRWPLLVLPVDAVPAHGDERHRRADGEGARPGEPAGAVLNEISDVVADAALYLPFALIAGVNAPLVVLVVVAGIVAEMTGALGPMLGGPAQLCRAVRQERPRLRLRPAGGADRRGAHARPVDHALSLGVAGAVGADRAQPRPRHRRPRQGQGGMSGVPRPARQRGLRHRRHLCRAGAGDGDRGAAALAQSGRALCRAHRAHQFVVVDDRRLHALRPGQPDRRHRVPRLHLLSRAEGISVADPDQADRPRRAAVRLSRHSHPVLLGGDRLVRHVHRVRAGVDVPVVPGADGAEGRDARLPARGRHAVLGPDDDGVHAQPHGVAAGVGRSGQPDRRRRWAAVLPGGADPVQRRGAISAGASSPAGTR